MTDAERRSTPNQDRRGAAGYPYTPAVPAAPFQSPTVDAVMLEQRAASFTTRSIKASSKRDLLLLAMSMLDLTTLEGKDSPEKVRAVCRKAVRPSDDDERVLGLRVPSAAAVCVYPALVPTAKGALAGSGVKVASVATGFPSGQYPIEVRLEDTRRAVADGADEIDMVINRGAFLAGRVGEVADEIRRTADACRGAVHTAHLKVILETGELETYDNIRRASDLAIRALHDAGAEHAFIKTSTGKVQPAATMPVTLVMLEAVRDHYLRTGRVIGVKPAGGIRTAKQAVHYLVMVHETMSGLPSIASANGARSNGVAEPLGNPWLTPDYFRFGASSLANDILRQLFKQATGRYMAGYDFSE